MLADAPGPTGNWTLDHNRVLANTLAVPAVPAEGEPAISGLGIGVSGGHDVVARHNVVKDNRDLHPSFASGGIVVQKGDGGTAPAGDAFNRNVLKNNSPFDIKWDGSGTATFHHNTCSTSSPSGLCS